MMLLEENPFSPMDGPLVRSWKCYLFGVAAGIKKGVDTVDRCLLHFEEM